MNYDIIGDIHGQIEKLEALLQKLGYRIKDGAYRNPEGRMAVFLGDLVDRGPGQVEVINIVRNMIEAGSGRRNLISATIYLARLVEAGEHRGHSDCHEW